MTWDEVNKRFPMDRDDMTQSEELEFVNCCFEAYESEGFSPVFWSPYEEYHINRGKKFKVIRRCNTTDWDLCTLPAWDIEFEDGTKSSAYPEEIIPSEMKANGCRLEVV